MGSMSVNLCGIELENPVIPASGTFGYGYEFAELYDINELGTFSFKGTTRDPRFPALMVCNSLFGGGLTCKLFQNVRERLSLCYYVSSMVYGAKGIVMVSSGIDTSNYTLAKDEILRQLEACQAGDITPEELTAYLAAAGFTDIRQYGSLKLRKPAAGEERIFFTARKPR